MNTEEHFEAAVDQGERSGTRLGPLGRPGQAREHFTTATTMYREMDMRIWLEEAEAEMRELLK
jgi:hypothetical protein